MCSGLRAGLGEHGADVLQRLLHLVGERGAREVPLGIPADLPGDVDLPARGDDAVAVAAWARATRRAAGS